MIKYHISLKFNFSHFLRNLLDYLLSILYSYKKKFCLNNLYVNYLFIYLFVKNNI